jgi:ribose-phosphate pyrophosphokinase
MASTSAPAAAAAAASSPGAAAAHAAPASTADPAFGTFVDPAAPAQAASPKAVRVAVDTLGPARTKIGRLKIITGNSNKELARSIADSLGIPVCDTLVDRFANGEVNIKVFENVRGEDVFIIQPTCGNAEEGIDVNTSIMELLLLINTLRLASARRITAVIPHYGYARQDRKLKSRVPISASAVARMIMTVAADAIVTVDLHCGQIQGFFHQVPLIDLNPATAFMEYANGKNFDVSKLVVVAPDAGAVTRARKLADKLKAKTIVTILKRRAKAGVVEEMQLVGEVTGCVCIIVDDMIDTGGTLCKAAELLAANGATEVHAYATHGIFTHPAADVITACKPLVEVVVTDSLPQAAALRKMGAKLRVIPLAPLLAEAILRIHTEESMEQVRQRAPLHSMFNSSVPADIDDAIHQEEDEELKAFPS